MAPAKWTVYSFTPVDDWTRLFSATVIGWLSKSENEAPKRKSFQMLVNCQITQTTAMGPDDGNMMRRKMVKNPAPSIIAARTSSVGNCW